MESNTAEARLTLEQIASLAQSLSPLEKLWLIEPLAPDLEATLRSAQPESPLLRRGLRGVLRGCAIGAKEIDAMRQEVWGGFPREDL